MDALTTIEDVHVIEERDRGLLCRIGAREVVIPFDAIGIADGTVTSPGERGRLVISRAVAAELGLLQPTTA
jgi:hypothetical protein